MENAACNKPMLPVIEEFKHNAVNSGINDEPQVGRMRAAIASLEKYERIRDFVNQYLASE